MQTSLEHFTLVDDLEKLAEFLKAIAKYTGPQPTPALYLDLEGVNLSRLGTLAILQVFLQPENFTYLVDVKVLGDAAFNTPISGDDTTSLATILSDPSTPKVLFDVRNDHDALVNLYQAEICGAIDLQLLELAFRGGGRNLRGLAKAMQNDAGLDPEVLEQWDRIKTAGVKAFAPEKGGSYEVWNVRPLEPAMLEYCAFDVKYMPLLWAKYSTALSVEWRRRIASETEKRLALAFKKSYDGKGRHMALAPYGWPN